MKVKVVGVRNDVHFSFEDGKMVTGRQIYYIKSAKGVDGCIAPSKPLFLNDAYYKDVQIKPNDNLNVSYNEHGRLEDCEVVRNG